MMALYFHGSEPDCDHHRKLSRDGIEGGRSYLLARSFVFKPGVTLLYGFSGLIFVKVNSSMTAVKTLL